MLTQMQLEVILVGNCIATRVCKAEANEEKGNRDLEREIKNKGDIFGGRTTWKFCSGGDKKRNASGRQCKEKMSGSEKKSEREHVRHFLHKKVSGSLTLWSCKTTAKKCTKKVCCTCKVAFLLIRPIVVFSPFSGIVFAAKHYTILYFVWTNYKYYWELRF